MADWHSRRQWDHTAALLSMIHNMQRDPKSSASSPDDFNPYRLRKKKLPQISLETVVRMYVKD